MKLNEAKIDVVRFEQGEWIDSIPEMGDLRLHVRGINNSDWRRMQAKLYEAVPRSKKPGGRVDADEQDRITTILLYSTSLLDWDGIEGDNGQPLPYSKEVAAKLLNDPSMRRFREAVAWAANRAGELEADDRKEIVGN